MRIALIRHPAPLIEPGLCYGRLDVELTRTATTQLGALAADPRLQGATHVWTSPARRCRGLAEAIALALTVPLTVDPRLRELDFGEWEGQPWNAIGRADLDRWATSPISFAPPGGESGAALIARIREVYAELCRGQQDCAIVSHGGPLKILTALLRGIPVDLLVAAQPIGSIVIVICPPA
jgi:alpha-ribazole phosphatase